MEWKLTRGVRNKSSSYSSVTKKISLSFEHMHKDLPSAKSRVWKVEEVVSNYDGRAKTSWKIV